MCNFAQNSGLPWILPKKTLSLDISGFADAIGDALGVSSLTSISNLSSVQHVSISSQLWVLFCKL